MLTDMSFYYIIIIVLTRTKKTCPFSLGIVVAIEDYNVSFFEMSFTMSSSSV